MNSRNVFLPNYSIGEDVYQQVPGLCRPYGKKVVFIGGKTALEKAGDLLRQALENTDIEIVDTLWYGGESAYANVEKLKEEKAVQTADVIFAIGGGKALDTCKVLSGDLGKAIFTFPTIASTCAAVTAVCAIYTVDGIFEGVYSKNKPPEHCFINTKIIAEAPDIYLWAGIGDTLAKGYEPEFSARGRKLDYYNALGIRISELCEQPLKDYGAQALTDCKNNHSSEEFTEVVLSIIVNTGLVSNSVINDYNSCVAHAMCYGFTTIPKVERNHLHGEIVSYGVLVQLMLDKKFDELNQLLEFYREIDLPTSYRQFDLQWEDMDGVFNKAVSVNDVVVAAEEITKEKLIQAVQALEKYQE